ncbi:MAG: DsbA family protein [Candidatus Promineifilaceae bacterium]
MIDNTRNIRRLAIALVALILLVALAACDSSSEFTGDGDSQSIQEDASASGSSVGKDGARFSSDESSIDDDPEQPTAESGSAETNQPQPVSSGDKQEGSSLDIDIESVETDANGMTVGFTADGHAFRGDPNAPVVIEEYSDFQCPYCSRFYSETMGQLDDNQISEGDAVLVFYDFPLNRIHPQAAPAARAARCAAEQGAANFWLMHDVLFENVAAWTNDNHESTFMDYAENIGLELADFDACLSENRYAPEVDADLAKGASLGISGTPSFIMNGELLVGAQPFQVFSSAISTLKEGGTLASANSNQQANQPSPAAAPTPAAFNDNYASAYGDPDAPVTIVEFTDYQCPYCARHSSDILPQIIQEMIDTGRVYYILKDFPLDRIHPDARKAAVAVRCGGEQDNYWELHDAVFSNQAEWAGEGDGANDYFTGYAADLGLDEDAYASCLESGRFDGAVEANVREGNALGVSGTPHFFVDGYPLNGARPFEHFIAAVSLAEEGRLAEAFTPVERPTPSTVEVPTGEAYSIGDPGAPITIVEYTDMQCPYCSRHNQNTFPRIIEQYVDTGQVRYVFKDFPLTQLHPQAVIAAEATRCALEQDAFLEMYDLLFDKQQEWSGVEPSAIFAGYADELGLDKSSFQECLSSNRYEAAVISDLQEGVAFGVTGTPSFFINGYPVTGAQPFEVFQQTINAMLEESAS